MVSPPGGFLPFAPRIDDNHTSDGVKAAVRSRYGSPEVLTVQEVTTPVPADDEVLIRVHAASVNRSD